jgi:hypothetical protein
MKTHPCFTALRRCFVGLLGLLAVHVATAQNAPAPKYRMVTLAYMKVEPGKGADYLKMEREWKAIHQDMVNKGRLTSWKLYAVSWPNGDGEEYDHVTMMEYPSFADMESPYVVDEMKKVWGDAKYAELRSKTGTVRKMCRTDTMTVLVATNNWSSAANRVLVVHYLRSLPGKADALIKIQREHYLPSNEELIQAGGAAAWATTRVRYPQQLDFPYDHVSFNGYESLAQMEKAAPQAWREKWTGDRAASVGPGLQASRTRVKGQLWRLLEQTDPRQSFTAR